uniref:Uncharacterized protein n=1 Tax=Arundo donax TaxID=35708 RepID=A0A0A9G0F9_ARUDO
MLFWPKRMCVSAMVSCRTCETSHFGASCSPTTSKSNFLLELTSFVTSSTDILPFMFHVMMHTQRTELVMNSQAL